MAQTENFNQSSNPAHQNSEAQDVLDIFWEKEMEDIRSLGPVNIVYFYFPL